MFNDRLQADSATAFELRGLDRSGTPLRERFRDEAEDGLLLFREEELRAAARRQAPAGNLLVASLRQAFYESRVRRWKRIPFRVHRNAEARQAYCAMNTVEFEGINARQCWANWRTIPRNLSGRVPARPLQVVDLCCGTGQSTEVLAYYLAAGSRILGLEFNPRFVEVARGRSYRDRRGLPAAVEFSAQSVLDTFEDARGRPVSDASIDLVNSSGAVGCHFDPEATRVLAGEVARVLRAGGLAMIDCGPGGTAELDLRAIFRAEGFEALHRARSCFLDRYTQVCFRKLDLAAYAGR